MALQKDPPKGAQSDEQSKPKGPQKSPEQLTREAKRTRLLAEAAKPDAKLLPEEWGEVCFPTLGVMPTGAVKRAGGHDSARHFAASALHGWDVDAYHQQDLTKRLRLTRKDYDAALKAPGGTPRKVEIERKRVDGTVVKSIGYEPVPHAAALSEWPAKLKQLATAAEKDGE